MNRKIFYLIKKKILEIALGRYIPEHFWNFSALVHLEQLILHESPAILAGHFKTSMDRQTRIFESAIKVTLFALPEYRIGMRFFEVCDWLGDRENTGLDRKMIIPLITVFKIKENLCLIRPMEAVQKQPFRIITSNYPTD